MPATTEISEDIRARQRKHSPEVVFIVGIRQAGVDMIEYAGALGERHGLNAPLQGSYTMKLLRKAVAEANEALAAYDAAEGKAP